MTRITSLIAFGCAALALAGGARTAIAVGVSDDRGKEANASAFFSTLHDLGLTENRVSIIWNPAQPSVIPQQQKIQQWLPYAQAAGVKIYINGESQETDIPTNQLNNTIRTMVPLKVGQRHIRIVVAETRDRRNRVAVNAQRCTVQTLARQDQLGVVATYT